MHGQYGLRRSASCTATWPATSARRAPILPVAERGLTTADRKAQRTVITFALLYAAAALLMTGILALVR